MFCGCCAFNRCKHLIPLKYGPEPHMLELKLHFPESMPDYAEKGASGTVLVEMAPVDLMPYSVLTFLDMVSVVSVGQCSFM